MILMVPQDKKLFPTLGPQVCDFMEQNLVFGPGDLRGKPLKLDEERRFFIWRAYEVYPRRHRLAGRRRFQRVGLSLRKGLAKTELAALIAACELHPEAPVRCTGWTSSGEPIGGGVTDPYIAMVSVNEEQTDLLAYGALKVILENSALKDDFDIGLQRIERRNGDGRAESLSTNPSARDGARTTFQCFDEPLALDTAVPTTVGWKAIGDIQAGDMVYGRSGGPVRVVGASTVKTGRPCFRVTFNNGASVVTDESHRWTVIDWRNRPRGEWQTTTGEMFVAGLESGYGWRWRLPRANGFDGVRATLPIDPYLLGLWLGDGATHAGYIHSAVSDYPPLSDGILHTVSQDARPSVVRWLSTGLRSSLRRAGLLGKKHIPTIYLFASTEQRVELLRGLMDSDGHTTPGGHCTFVQKHRELCEQVAVLVRSLGANATVTEQPDSRSVTGHICKVHFSPAFAPFRLARKVNAAQWCRRRNTSWPAVVSIEPVESVPVRCIAVDSDDHLFLVGTGLHLTHNTHHFTLPRLIKTHRTMLNNLPKRKIADAWALEITTAPEPGSGSVAEATMNYAKAVSEGQVQNTSFFYFHRQASDHHDLTTDEGRRAAVIEATGPAAEKWSNIDGIVGILDDPEADAAYWERVYCNRLVKGGSQAFDILQWDTLKRTENPVKPGDLITLGLDGAQFFDSTGIVATHVETGFQWKPGVWERPTSLRPDQEWQVPAEDVDVTMRRLFEMYTVWRLYADPPYWQSWIAKWRGEYGEEVVIEWWTNRTRQMTAALEGFTTAITDGTVSHDGDPDLRRHLGNARKRELPGRDEEGKALYLIQKDRPKSPNKMDLAMCAVLSWEARTDAIAAGAQLVKSVYLTRGVRTLGA